MTFLRNDFSKIFDILFTTPIYREDAYLSSNDELKIKAKDLRLKPMAVKCSIEKYLDGLTNPFRQRGWSDCWYKKTIIPNRIVILVTNLLNLLTLYSVSFESSFESKPLN